MVKIHSLHECQFTANVFVKLHIPWSCIGQVASPKVIKQGSDKVILDRQHCRVELVSQWVFQLEHRLKSPLPIPYCYVHHLHECNTRCNHWLKQHIHHVKLRQNNGRWYYYHQEIPAGDITCPILWMAIEAQAVLHKLCTGLSHIMR